jgi:hypothetical protein
MQIDSDRQTKAPATSALAPSSSNVKRRMRTERTSRENSLLADIHLDDQKAKMDRYRTISMNHNCKNSDANSIDVDARKEVLEAKRLNIRVKFHEEIYVYIFHSAVEADMAVKHWLLLQEQLQQQNNIRAADNDKEASMMNGESSGFPMSSTSSLKAAPALELYRFTVSEIEVRFRNAAQELSFENAEHLNQAIHPQITITTTRLSSN